MATFNPITITNAGEEILAQAVAGDGTLTFTAVSTSSDTQSGDLEAITELQNIKQTVAPVIAILSDNTIQISAIFSNGELDQGYTANTLGIYAKLGSENAVLFAVATAIDPDIIPASNPQTPSNFYYQFNIAITDSSQITVSVPEGGNLPASVFYQKFGSANISQIGDGTVTGAITQNANVAGGDKYDSAKSYAAGDYFIYNDQFCKALTAIASGAALTPGNNYQVTSLENEISGLNGKSRYQGTYSNTYANGEIFEVFKNNGLAIFPINANLHDISEEWVNIAALASAEIYPYVGTFLYSIPVRSTSGVFQIMLNAGDKYIKGRYSGDVISTLVIQDTLVWVTN